MSLGPRAAGTAWDWHIYSRVLTGTPEPSVVALANSGTPSYAGFDTAFRAGGIAGAARNVLAVTKEWPHTAWRRAHWRMVLGDRTGALEELETAYRLRRFDLMSVAVDPMFEPLRSEPRFRAIVEGMKLSPAGQPKAAQTSSSGE